ncbi:Uncharacterised protein [Mycolicibacterium gilvum]|uniref:Uncharacterized protein n=1 Tax=Mycolicibacterium gilvum TaxID=1804 RepID=A0A378SMZ3_9MYCO|nr:Uncharacterised protein [Mycolicibacterium gilvum]
MSWSMSRDGIAELNDVMKKHGLNAPLIAIEATGRLSLARVMGPPDCQGDGTTVARY